MKWTTEDNCLTKTYKFSDFKTAINFMSVAAVEVDKLDHHPEWKNIYNRVEIKLSTHEAGNIVTEKDRELAGILDEIYLTFL